MDSVRLSPAMALLPLAAAAILGSGLSGCRPPAAPVQTHPTPPSPTSIEAAHRETSFIGALLNTLSDPANAAIFPSGVRVLHTTDTDGVLTVDLSKEFKGVVSRSEADQARARKALHGSLAPFKSIVKMSVTVEGKPLHSKALDWSAPYPIRNSKTGSAR
jgi:hypothetical protein